MKIKFGGKEFLLNSGDMVFIPADTLYEVSGKFKTITINAPAFDIKDEKTIEN